MRTIQYFILSTFLFFITLDVVSQGKEILVYQIQIAAYEGEVDWEKYKGLVEFGVISTKSIATQATNDQLTRVYLGKYLGTATATNIGNKVKQKGFSVGYEKQTLEQNATHTIQLGVFSRLNLKQFTELEYLSNLYIKFENNKYRVLYGLYESESHAENALETLEFQGLKGVVKPL